MELVDLENVIGTIHAQGSFVPKFGRGELGHKPLELVGGEGVSARSSKIEVLRIVCSPGTPEVACA